MHKEKADKGKIIYQNGSKKNVIKIFGQNQGFRATALKIGSIMILTYAPDINLFMKPGLLIRNLSEPYSFCGSET
jgi:hypothetical protein